MRTQPISGSTKQMSRSRFAEECPMTISRDFSAECSSSGKIRASGLLNTETASAKLTPCFCWLDRALRGSHSNTKDIASDSNPTCRTRRHIPRRLRIRKLGEIVGLRVSLLTDLHATNP